MKTIHDIRLRTVVAAVLIFTMIFPPFIIDMPGGLSAGCGFGFFFSWPEFRGGPTCRVDTALLVAEWVFAVLLLAVYQWKSVAAMLAARMVGGNKDRDAQMAAVYVLADAIIRHAEVQNAQKDPS